MNKKILILILIFVIVFIFLIYYFFFRKKQKSSLELFGNIEIRQVDLAFRVPGRLDVVYFEEGDYVKKGQILAKLDTDTYQTSLKEARARLLDIKAEKINAENIYKRNLALCSDLTLSKQECEKLLTNKDKASADFDLAKAQVQEAQISLNDTILRAPNDGIILTRIIEPGSILSAGTPVYSLSLFRPLWARAYVSEKDLGKIKLGQNAYISSDSLPDKKFNAHIGFISPVAEFTPKTVETVSLRTDLVYRLRVIVDEKDENLNLYLRQGMPVNIEIPLDKEVLDHV